MASSADDAELLQSCTERFMDQTFTLLSPSITVTGTEVAGQRCLAGRGLSQFQRIITCAKATEKKCESELLIHFLFHLNSFIYANMSKQIQITESLNQVNAVFINLYKYNLNQRTFFFTVTFDVGKKKILDEAILGSVLPPTATIKQCCKSTLTSQQYNPTSRQTELTVSKSAEQSQHWIKNPYSKTP